MATPTTGGRSFGSTRRGLPNNHRWWRPQPPSIPPGRGGLPRWWTPAWPTRRGRAIWRWSASDPGCTCTAAHPPIPSVALTGGGTGPTDRVAGPGRLTGLPDRAAGAKPGRPKQLRFCQTRMAAWGMAKKSICHYYILIPQHFRQSWISSIRNLPVDTFLNPRLNSYLVILPVKHRLHFFFCHAVKNWRIH